MDVPNHVLSARPWPCFQWLCDIAATGSGVRLTGWAGLRRVPPVPLSKVEVGGSSVVISRSAPSRAALVLITSWLTLAGCTSDDPGSKPSTAPLSAGPGASASNTGAEDAAVAAYREMWAAFAEAAKTSDPDAPDIRKYASDNALKLIVGGLVTNRSQGKVVKGDLVLNPKATVVSPAEETILDCVDATHWLEYKANGELWDNKPGGKHRTTATVKNVDGTWKVSSFNLEGTGTC